MLRTALKPKWLGLLVLALVVIALFWRLGLWQLHVAQDKGSGQSVVAANPDRPPVPVDSLLQPHADFPGELSGRLVTMTGRYAADRQVLVAGRLLDGRSGFWVVTPLYATGAADAAQADVLPVARGFVASAADVPPPPSGPLTVTGSLAPGESPSTTGNLPAGQLGTVDLSVLVNQWPGQLYNAFVFATAETSAGGGSVAPGAGLTRIPPPNPTGDNGGLAWRNAAYAVQWWVFALFAAWMWVKMVRDDQLTTEAARRAEDDVADNEAQEPAEQKDPAP